MMPRPGLLHTVHPWRTPRPAPASAENPEHLDFVYNDGDFKFLLRHIESMR